MCAAVSRNCTSQKELDEAYDVEGSVPDFSVYADQFVRLSLHARQSLCVRENVRFGPTMPEYADIFPARRPDAPVLIFVHGGYWRMLTAKEFSFVASGFQPHDVTVVVANYDLCPRVSISEITRQMRSLVAWTASNIRRYHGDPDAISMCGHSAGGHLAAMCALTGWSDYGLPDRLIRAIFPISGLFDLEPISQTFLQSDLRISARDIAEASPQNLIRRIPVRMHISYGSEESSEFARHSEEFLMAWRRAGNAADGFSLPERNHFTAITDLADPKSEQVAAILDVMGAGNTLGRGSVIDRRLFPFRLTA